MDREWCLIGIKKASKLNKDEIYKDFSTVVRERRRDEDGLFVQMYGPEIKSNLANEISFKSNHVQPLGMSMDSSKLEKTIKESF